jgi:xylitol oxidase
LASLPHISVAGACSTATHGSGEKNGNLATAVSALEMVNANGDLVKLSRSQDGEAFRGAVVGLGALGVITKLTLDIQPRFIMKQYVYQDLPMDELKEHFDAIESSAYSVSLFTDWQKPRINEVWLKIRMPEQPVFDASAEFFGAQRAKRNLHPIIELSAENCTSRWVCLVPGMTDCLISAWGLFPAPAKNFKPNTSCPAAMRSMPFSRSRDSAIKLVHIC